MRSFNMQGREKHEGAITSASRPDISAAYHALDFFRGAVTRRLRDRNIGAGARRLVHGGHV